ncbi:MAG TPA: gluconate 2-dehydrogenase subunit 3 family protein [Steroidobacteraceae bacterium]|nr:gluconate 2-dehydrogenase subunit 3 family protein [Steroidobacteraceae bacterium]
MDRREFLEVVAGLSALVPGLIGEEAYAQSQARARGAAKMRTLDPLQEATVTRVADILVPQTDTVGATGVGVTAFIDLLLSDSMRPLQRERFLEGLAAINARSQERYGAPLPSAKPEEQETLLRTLDAQLPHRDPTPAELRALAQAPVTAERGYAVLKALVLLGYFTSEPVAQGLLISAPIIPGRYDGCIPV